MGHHAPHSSHGLGLHAEPVARMVRGLAEIGKTVDWVRRDVRRLGINTIVSRLFGLVGRRGVTVQYG
jgi:hypothetical protein